MVSFRRFHWWQAKKNGDPHNVIPEIYLQAVAAGQVSLMQSIIKIHQLEHYSADDGYQAIHIAARKGYLPIIKYLVQCCNVPIDVCCRSTTPLALACYWGQKAVVKWLIEHQADRNACDHMGASVLMYAVSNPEMDDDPTILKHLMSRHLLLDSTNRFGYTALLLAASQKKFFQTYYLIEQGASIYATTNAGYTLAHFAAQHNWDMGLLIECHEQACYDRQQAEKRHHQYHLEQQKQVCSATRRYRKVYDPWIDTSGLEPLLPPAT
ncbi:MAG: ankyrin repeat domain-containing protein [Coxiellaceae bacterium]|nr:ankyrin repeat domain-containing protein [Coxiellaceae bacterium]